MPKTLQPKNRDIAIDLCRILGTLLVMLAHVTIPTFLSEVRSFDVILLVIVSGICFSGSVDYRRYIWKRIKRLVFPTWILLILLFACAYVACILLNRAQVYSFTQIWKSFLFLEGSIGYIWIVRVYLGIAIINPIISRFNKSISPLFYLVVLNLVIIAFSLFFSSDQVLIYYVQETVIYCLLAFWGTKLNSLEQKPKEQFIVNTILISLIGLIVTLIINGFHPNAYKYPPVGQYIYYGLGISVLIIVFLRRVNLDAIPERTKNVLSYWSTKSFTLYLVHIFVLSMMNSAFDSINLSLHWAAFYFILIVSSMIGVLLIDKFWLYICSMLNNRKKCEK